MIDEAAPRGRSLSESKDIEERRRADALATALCGLEDDLEAGDVLFVTARDGVRQEKLEGTRLDALLERALGFRGHEP